MKVKYSWDDVVKTKHELFKLNNARLEYARNFLKLFAYNGYTLSGYSNYQCEDTFIFENSKIAKDAFERIELDKELVVGYFYGKDEFIRIINYESEYYRPFIIWFD